MQPNSHVKVGAATFGNDLPFTLIAGPCQLESRAHAFDMAGMLVEIAKRLGIGLVYKTSYDKANRTSLNAARGVGLEKALAIFDDLRKKLGVPVLTDVHEPGQCAEIAEVVDVLQIPAFLCRQTDLLIAAAQTGRCVNVKKGQFLAPWDMRHATAKCESTGNPNVLVTERGTTFGHGRLVVDMTGLVDLSATGHPVVFDATHSVQRPGGADGTTGGDRELVPVLARAAVATGEVDGLFFEVHPDPDRAPSDGPNMVRLDGFGSLLAELVRLHRMVHGADGGPGGKSLRAAPGAR
jgi:2-dehydro-3-deoxyphosphooctonate aldolase (KDO 8-P synthase)